jgi:catechol 2,3-dioxygenase-like lactoylglutathione lyase family enzyme
MPVRRIVPDLPTQDPAASKAFSVDVLGLAVAMDLGWVVTFAAPGDRTAQITVMGDDASAAVRPAVSIEVDHVDAVHAAAQRLGHEIVHPLTDEPWGVRRSSCATPAAAARSACSGSCSRSR